MSAWALASRGHQVELYERGELVSATSSASTKLIHGGLRYLEQAEFRLVREALRERQFWLASAPHIVHRLELLVPVYKSSRRPRWIMRTGLLLYDILAGKRNLGRHRSLNREQLIGMCPELNPEGLLGGFAFFDAQMDDRTLGLWAAEQATRAGVRLQTETEVLSITETGGLLTKNGALQYDVLFNIAGPWAEELLQRSQISSNHHLELVRGSHLVLSRPANHAFLVEVPNEDRFCFILPYQGQTLLGTTEVRQSLHEPIACTGAEESYLLRVFNHYIHPTANRTEIVARFSGLRPLIRSNSRLSHITREYVIERQGRVFTVFGGKWTTSRALGMKVASQAESWLRTTRI